jgi:hypothetical protein
MIKIRIISESRVNTRRRKINSQKLRTKKAKQAAARENRRIQKNATKYMKFMNKVRPYLKKLPRGTALYAALTAPSLAHKGWEALNTRAIKLGYPAGHVWEAFKGTQDSYAPNHTVEMLTALINWARSTEILLSAVPGYDEISWLASTGEKLGNWMKGEDHEARDYIIKTDGNPDIPADSNGDGWTTYPPPRK